MKRNTKAFLALALIAIITFVSCDPRNPVAFDRKDPILWVDDFNEDLPRGEENLSWTEDETPLSRSITPDGNAIFAAMNGFYPLKSDEFGLGIESLTEIPLWLLSKEDVEAHAPGMNSEVLEFTKKDGFFSITVKTMVGEYTLSQVENGKLTIKYDAPDEMNPWHVSGTVIPINEKSGTYTIWDFRNETDHFIRETFPKGSVDEGELIAITQFPDDGTRLHEYMKPSTSSSGFPAIWKRELIDCSDYLHPTVEMKCTWLGTQDGIKTEWTVTTDLSQNAPVGYVEVYTPSKGQIIMPDRIQAMLPDISWECTAGGNTISNSVPQFYSAGPLSETVHVTLLDADTERILKDFRDNGFVFEDDQTVGKTILDQKGFEKIYIFPVKSLITSDIIGTVIEVTVPVEL